MKETLVKLLGPLGQVLANRLVIAVIGAVGGAIAAHYPETFATLCAV